MPVGAGDSAIGLIDPAAPHLEPAPAAAVPSRGPADERDAAQRRPGDRASLASVNLA